MRLINHPMNARRNIRYELADINIPYGFHMDDWIFNQNEQKIYLNEIKKWFFIKQSRLFGQGASTQIILNFQIVR